MTTVCVSRVKATFSCQFLKILSLKNNISHKKVNWVSKLVILLIKIIIFDLNLLVWRRQFRRLRRNQSQEPISQQVDQQAFLSADQWYLDRPRLHCFELIDLSLTPPGYLKKYLKTKKAFVEYCKKRYCKNR